MKPFTFMTVVLALILGYSFAASRTRHVVDPIGARPLLVALVDDDDENEDGDGREAVEGLPVRIVPGTHVTEAEIKPPVKAPWRESSRYQPGERRQRSKHREGVVESDRVYRSVIEEKAPPSTVRSISGRLSATSERARADARLQLDREVTVWLTPEVPTGWKPPAHLITGMVLKTDVQPIVKDYGKVYTLHEATLEADFAPHHRGAILAAYHREVVAHRLLILGAGLGFVLACLASLAGYIRADEATKGYYTRWLRVVATASIGGTGMLIYHFLT